MALLVERPASPFARAQCENPTSHTLRNRLLPDASVSHADLQTDAHLLVSRSELLVLPRGCSTGVLPIASEQHELLEQAEEEEEEEKEKEEEAALPPRALRAHVKRVDTHNSGQAGCEAGVLPATGASEFVLWY